MSPIFLPRQGAFGLLQVDDTRPRDFDGHDSAFLRTCAAILGPIVDRLPKLRDLRATEERFRLTVETAADYAVFVTDAEDRITDWLPGAAAVFGWTAGEDRGKPSVLLYTPEDRAAGVPEDELARCPGRAGGSASAGSCATARPGGICTSTGTRTG